MPDSSPVGVEKLVVQETGSGRYQAAATVDGRTFLIDEPVSLGGLGSGPTPYDLLGAALGACTAMTVRLYAERKAWPLDHVSVRVGHVRGTLEARDRFDRELTLEGKLDDAQRARLLEIANRCPVHKTLERGADVETRLTAPTEVTADGSSHGMHVAHMIESCAD